MSASYTYDQLKQIKGQAVKDIWHGLIGKPAGIKNTTGLKNSEEIIQAILEAQRNPEFLKKFNVRPRGVTLAFEEAPKHQEQEQPKEMPPKQPKTEKKKPGPKPKPVVAPAVAPQRSSPTLAYESSEMPIVPTELKRVVVKKLFVDDSMYFLESKTNKLYADADGRPGSLCGSWNPQTRQVMTLEA